MKRILKMENMVDLKQYANILKQEIDFCNDPSFGNLSHTFHKKNYKSKLVHGIEYGCEKFIEEAYPIWLIDKNMSFFYEVLNETIIGLMSEILRAEAAVIFADRINSAVTGFMWWGIGKEDDCASISQWLNVLKDISILPASAPCGLGKIKSLRSASSKKNELIQLWDIIYESRQAGSKFGGYVYKPETFNVLRNFSTTYHDVTNVYGFTKLLNATESSAKKLKEVQENDLLKKQISITSRIVAGRAKLIICRTDLDQRKKAEAWITATYDRFKNPQKTSFAKRPLIERLQLSLEEMNKGDFESILKQLFAILIDDKECSDDEKHLLINLIEKIYKTQNNSCGEPPWYPDFRKEPYYPNPDVEKCAHFLFVLGRLGQGNLEGRWEKESLQFLLKNQTLEGCWSSSTFQFRPDNYATIVAMHALGLWKPEGWEKAVKKAADWLWTQQRPDGSWRLYGDMSQFNIVLSAIDLAEGQSENSLQLAENAIEFVDIEKSHEPESQTYVTDNIATDNSFEFPSNIDKSSIQESFVFRSGQVLLGGKDLGIKTGAAQDTLKILVNNFGFVVTFKTLNSQSTDYEASVMLRSTISYLRKKLRRLPVRIENRRQSGYMIQLSS